MELYSTNNASLRVDFKEAVFNSLPADNGLYMPVHIPALDSEFIDNIDQYSFPEIAFNVAKCLLEDSIPEPALRNIIDDSINFPAPIVQLDANTYVLELFHGPSLAFKDFGARFMSRVMSYYLKEDGSLLDILVATSGDTGGAVALGFLEIPGTRVTILYPKGKVSAIQELQLTTNGKNIRAIEINGSFDDCQALVKQAFTDNELNSSLRLTSANSINIARLIPQTFYYFNAYAQLTREGKTNPVFSVPSGNLGNIAAGLIAWKMGLPVKQFLAATNANDTVPRFLKSGVFKPKKSIQTISNAMDVGNPSNLARIINLFRGDFGRLKDLINSYSFSDSETMNAIQGIFELYNYVVCPHSAISWLAVRKWRAENLTDNSPVIFLSTAHACKFPDVYEGEMLELVLNQGRKKFNDNKKKQTIKLPVDFKSFKEYLLK